MGGVLRRLAVRSGRRLAGLGQSGTSRQKGFEDTQLIQADLFTVATLIGMTTRLPLSKPGVS